MPGRDDWQRKRLLCNNDPPQAQKLAGKSCLETRFESVTVHGFRIPPPNRHVVDMTMECNCHADMTISPQVHLSCRQDIFVSERKSSPRPTPAIVAALTESTAAVVGAHQQSRAGRRLCLRKHNPLRSAGALADRRIIFAQRNLRGFVAATQFRRYSKSRHAPKKSLWEDDWRPWGLTRADSERLAQKELSARADDSYPNGRLGPQTVVLTTGQPAPTGKV
jgi:hypothetical protein